MLKKQNLYTFPFFCFLILVTVFITVQFRWVGFSGSDWKSIIDGDGKDYYAYIEQVFVTNDFGNAPADCEQTHIINGRSVIKCYCGTALLISPFFLAVKATSGSDDISADAYGEAFQKSISFAAIFYLLLGLWFLFRLLKQLRIKTLYALLSLFFIYLATNLLTYSILHPAMSHVYSFSMMSGFLWASNSYIINPKWRYLVTSAVLLGLIYLIRPVNIIILGFVLFFFNDTKSASGFIKRNIKRILVFAFILICTMSIQNILWMLQCGKFSTWPYLHEGFYFFHPEIFNVLFSFRKGLLIYTPVLLFSLAGLFYIFKENKYRFLVSLLFITLLTYIISSWWCWTYSDSFGMRPFVDFYALFAIFSAILFQKINTWLRTHLMLFCLVCLLLNLVQTYQYDAQIIHPEYMNLKSYKYVFLKTSLKYSNCIGGANDLVPYNKFDKTLIAEKKIMGDTSICCNAGPDSGRMEQVILFDDENEFNDYIIFENDKELSGSNNLYADICLKKWDFIPQGSSNACFTILLTYDGQTNAYYNSFPLDYLPGTDVSQWVDLKYSVMLPRIKNPAFKLKFYVWNMDFQYFLIQDIRVKIFRTA